MVLLLIFLCLAACSQGKSKELEGPTVGANFTSWQPNALGTDDAKEALGMLQGVGANTAVFVVTWYQENGAATFMGPMLERTPTDDSLRAAVAHAKSLGMRVGLKPHVDVLDGSWRGEIEMTSEANWDFWWGNYQDFVEHYLELGRELDVDYFVIGTELKKTTGQRRRWEELIGTAREMYSGKLTYAANWDNYSSVGFWDKLDYIGVDAYWPVTSSETPTLMEASTRWKMRLAEVESLSVLLEVPILFTEFGYQDRNGTGRTPWWSDGEPDQEEQAICLEAALSTIATSEHVAGTWLWMTYYRPQLNVDGFDFLGKAAEDIVRQYWLMD